MPKRMVMAGLVTMMLAATTVAYAGNFFVTRHGKRFHQPNCPLIKGKSVLKLNEKTAEDKGLEPCAKCLKQQALRAEEPKKVRKIKSVMSKKQIKAQKKAEKEKKKIK